MTTKQEYSKDITLMSQVKNVVKEQVTTELEYSRGLTLMA
jgi:hypothetical protein